MRFKCKNWETKLAKYVTKGGYPKRGVSLTIDDEVDGEVHEAKIYWIYSGFDDRTTFCFNEDGDGFSFAPNDIVVINVMVKVK